MISQILITSLRLATQACEFIISRANTKSMAFGSDQQQMRTELVLEANGGFGYLWATNVIFHFANTKRYMKMKQERELPVNEFNNILMVNFENLA